MNITEKRFVVIRRNTLTKSRNNLYFDWTTLSPSPLRASAIADRYDRKNGEYADIHPQVDCVRVIVTVDPVRAKGTGISERKGRK